jgi:hypothetical protein
LDLLDPYFLLQGKKGEAPLAQFVFIDEHYGEDPVGKFTAVIALLLDERPMELFRSFIVEGLHRLLPEWNGIPSNLESLHASDLPRGLTDEQKASLFDLVNEATSYHSGKIFRLGYYNDSIGQTLFDEKVAPNNLPLAYSAQRLHYILLRYLSQPFVSIFEHNRTAFDAIDRYFNDTDLHLEKSQVSGSTNAMKWLLEYNGDSLGTFYAPKRNIHLWAVDFIAWQLKIRHEKRSSEFKNSCIRKFDRIDDCIYLDAVFWLNDFDNSTVFKNLLDVKGSRVSGLT